MKLLAFDHDGNRQIVLDFIRDMCPPELVEQVKTLVDLHDWDQLENLLAPFYNTPV